MEARCALLERVLDSKEIDRVKTMAVLSRAGRGPKTLTDLKNDPAIAEYLQGAVSATIHRHDPRNAGKFDINFSSIALRQEAAKASRTNRP